MLTTRLIGLIEDHADRLTDETVRDIMSNPRTPSFRKVPHDELVERVGALYHHLGNWIGDRKDDAVREAYEDWGRRRFRQGILMSEIVYTLMIAKQHLSRYIRDHGLVEYSGDRVIPGEFLPMQLHALQELTAMVGEFFDRALYYLTRGYEKEALDTSRAARPTPAWLG